MFKKKLRIILIFLLSVLCGFGIFNASHSNKKVKAIARTDVKCVGVDISTWQGTVNFDTLKSKASFVILRLGYSTGQDGRFDTYIKQVLEKGIPFGVYIYSLASDTTEAINEANWTINKLNSYGLSNGKLTYPVFLDYEMTANDGETPVSSRPAATNTAIINAFLDTVRAGGYYPALYCGGAHVRYGHINASAINGDLWIAAYGVGFNTFTNYYYNNAAGKCTMWQYNTGAYDSAGLDVYLGADYGVGSTYIDQNYCFIDYPSKIMASGLNGFNGSTPNPNPTPTPDPTPSVTIEKKGFGTTLSELDGNVNFSKLLQNNVKFTFVTLGNSTTKTIDSKFQQNVNGINSIGIHCGVFVNSSASSTTQANQEAVWVIEKLKSFGYLKGQLTFPIVFAWDYSVKNLTTSTAIVNEFANVLKENNLVPLLFTSGNNFYNYISTASLACDVYLAWYPTDCALNLLPTTKYYNEKVKLWQYSNGDPNVVEVVNADYFTGSQLGSETNYVTLNYALYDYDTDIIFGSKNISNHEAEISNNYSNWNTFENYAKYESNYNNRKIVLKYPQADINDNKIEFLNTNSTAVKVGACFKVLGKVSTEKWGKFGITVTDGTKKIFFFVDAKSGDSAPDSSDTSTIIGTDYGLVYHDGNSWNWSTNLNKTYKNNYNVNNAVMLEVVKIDNKLVLIANGEVQEVINLTKYDISTTGNLTFEIRSFNMCLEVTEYYSRILNSEELTLRDYEETSNIGFGNTIVDNSTTNWNLTKDKATLSIDNLIGGNDLYFNQSNETNLITQAKFHVTGKTANEEYGKFGITFSNSSGNGFFFYADARGTKGLTTIDSITGTALGWVSLTNKIANWTTEIEIQEIWSASVDSLLKIVRNDNVYKCYIDEKLIFTLDGEDFGMNATDKCYPYIVSYNVGLEVTNFSSTPTIDQIVCDTNFNDWQNIMSKSNNICYKTTTNSSNNKKAEIYYLLTNNGLNLYARAEHLYENSNFSILIQGSLAINEFYANTNYVKGFTSYSFKTEYDTTKSCYVTILEAFINNNSLNEQLGYSDYLKVGAIFSATNSEGEKEMLQTSNNSNEEWAIGENPRKLTTLLSLSDTPNITPPSSNQTSSGDNVNSARPIEPIRTGCKINTNEGSSIILIILATISLVYVLKKTLNKQ